MGTYVNPGFDNFNSSRKNKFYVDKSMLIALLNEKIGTDDRFLCVSRPRRFGKTMAANMIAAYYSKGCDSHEIFSDLKISKDPSYEENINKYTVIQLDMNDVMKNKGKADLMSFISRRVIEELKEEYTFLNDEALLGVAIQDIYKKTGDKFIFIIDEYDLIIWDNRYKDELECYLDFLISLFKSNASSRSIALAYLTGIMPIVREKVQSKLNNFTEYTMLNAKNMASFMGFTEDEVRSLAKKSGMDFGELKRWYDGYNLRGLEVYSPKSVISAIEDHECNDYWIQTSSYEAVTDYISLDLDGLKKDVFTMLSGGRVEVNTSFYRNTLCFDTKDDVLTYLIHIGYLSYDAYTSSCFIPNNEIKDMWAHSMERTKGYQDVANMIKGSKELLEATWNGDEKVVSEGVAKAHREACSILQYNNEGTFQSALYLAYYYAKSYYTIVNELPAGKGFADVAFIPYEPNIPAIIIELKKDDSVENAIDQIKDRKYPEALENYKDNLLLVAISYDSKTKEYFCKIEKAEY